MHSLSRAHLARTDSTDAAADGLAPLQPTHRALSPPAARLGSRQQLHFHQGPMYSQSSPPQTYQSNESPPPSALGLSNLTPERLCYSCDYTHWPRPKAADHGARSSFPSSYTPPSAASRARTDAMSLNKFDFSLRRSRATSISSLRSTCEPSPPASPSGSESGLFFADWTLASPLMRGSRAMSDKRQLDSVRDMAEHAETLRALRPFDDDKQPMPTSRSSSPDQCMSPSSPTESLSSLSDYSTTAHCGGNSSGGDDGGDQQPHDMCDWLADVPMTNSSDDHVVQQLPWAAAHRQLKHWLASGDHGGAPAVLNAARLADFGVTAGAGVPKTALRRKADEGDIIVTTPTVSGQPVRLVIEREHSHRAAADASKSSSEAALCDALTVHSFALPRDYAAQSPWCTTDPLSARISCTRWNGDVWLTVHDVIAVLVFRLACVGFEVRGAAARAKLSEGCYSDLRACFEVRDFLAINAGSAVLKAFASIGAVKSTKTQRVYRWGAICHDRLLVSALQRDVERAGKGIELVCKAVREPALSLQLAQKPEVARQLGIEGSPTVAPAVLSAFAFGNPAAYARGRGYGTLRAASENVSPAYDLPAGRSGRARRRSSSPLKPKPQPQRLAATRSTKSSPAGRLALGA